VCTHASGAHRIGARARARASERERRRVHALHMHTPCAHPRAFKHTRGQEKIRSVGTSDGYVSERYPRRCLINREGETRDKRNPASTRLCLSRPTTVSGSILREIPAWGGWRGGEGGGGFSLLFSTRESRRLGEALGGLRRLSRKRSRLHGCSSAVLVPFADGRGGSARGFKPRLIIQINIHRTKLRQRTRPIIVPGARDFISRRPIHRVALRFGPEPEVTDSHPPLPSHALPRYVYKFYVSDL